MLQLGEQKKRKRGMNGEIAFVEANAQQLPFEDQMFQVVCVAFGLHNVADTDRGLAEMARVCQSGGRVAVLEFSRPRFSPLSTLYKFYFRHVLPRIGQRLAKNDASAYAYLFFQRRRIPRRRGRLPAACRRRRFAGRLASPDDVGDRNTVCGNEVRREFFELRAKFETRNSKQIQNQRTQYERNENL